MIVYDVVLCGCCDVVCFECDVLMCCVMFVCGDVWMCDGMIVCDDVMMDDVWLFL